MPHESSILSRALSLTAIGVLTVGLAACSSGGAEPAPTAASEVSASPTATPTTTPEPSAQDVDGRWCPTAESAESRGCVTIALPNATYDDGATVSITEHGGPTAQEDGGFSFSTTDAPFGVYYPAGIAIQLPDYYPGSDRPDADRVWNSQSGVMLTRVAPPKITAENCSSIDGKDALAAWGGELGAAPSGAWDLTDSMGWAEDTYDACATLSWIVVPLQDCCLAGYPFQVMLFHKGEFVQAATEEIYGRAPQVTRASDSRIEITYEWVPDGGSSVGPFESAVSTFTWDEASNSVVRQGELPPVHF